MIELLAVITIMGILMLVAIPTISRSIENSRKDTFIDTAKKYSDAVRNMWVSDGFSCTLFPETDNEITLLSSSVPTGMYYVKVDGDEGLLESGGKSPWGQRQIKGMIFVGVWAFKNNIDILYYPVLVDGVHGVNINSEGDDLANPIIPITRIKRKNLVMSNGDYSIFSDKDWTVKMDINLDGDVNDVIDGIYEERFIAAKCTMI